MDTVAGSPGANDNASGVGAIITLARELADEPPAVPLVLVGFGAEEFQPSEPREHHIGSEAYAAAHSANVVSMLSVDMVGDGFPTRIWWYEVGPDTLVDRLVSTASGLGRRDEYEVDTRGDISDHGPFARRGVPAAFLYSGLTPRYHTPQDTSEWLKAADIERSGTLTLEFLRSLEPGDSPHLRDVPIPA